MIKIFRKMRHKLLAENKFSRYLFYVIGEIILVVFGILIALQINNANELRKEKLKTKDYLLKICSNVQNDMLQINSLKIRRDTIRINAIKSSNALRKKSTFNIEHVFKGQSCFYEFYFIANTSGYEALKSSIYLGKINNTKIDSLLTIYYARVEKIAEDEKSYNEFIEKMEAHLNVSIDITPLTNLHESWNNNEDINLSEYYEILPYLKNNAYKSAIYRTAEDRSYVFNYKEIIISGNALIKEIDIYLKSKK